jgi:defect-in-organelle-trafficking protein DotC
MNIDTGNLSQLENIRVQPRKSSPSATELSQLRARSLRDTAMSLGAQGGLAFASEKLNESLEQNAKHLSSIFNFNAMVLSHGIMPPVLEESSNNLNLADSSTIRVADKMYKIIQQARFATTPPHWREYLWLSYSKPTLPDKSLLPKSTEEHRIWKQGIHIGWEKGIQQSYSIFQQNLARLKRDYQGMVLYRKLLQQKMISPPFVARTELGITGNGSDMRINDQVLRIVELPKLQTSGRHWNAVVVKHHE